MSGIRIKNKVSKEENYNIPQQDRIHLAKIQGYDFVTLLGEGSYGRVYKAYHKTQCCVKIMRTSRSEQKQLIERQLKISRHMINNPHRNIINFYKAEKIAVQEKTTTGFVVMQMGYMTLSDLIGRQKQHPIKIQTKLRFIFDILNGIKHLHSLTITHRDIKADNIVKCQNNVLKIVDFGCARLWQENQYKNIDHSNKVRNTMGKGTEILNAPEMLMEIEYKTIGASDIWMCGNLIALLVWGIKPTYNMHSILFNDDNRNKNLKLGHKIVVKDCQNFVGEDQLIELVNKCFMYHPDNRIISEHLFEQFKDKIFPGKQNRQIQLEHIESTRIMDFPSKIQLERNKTQLVAFKSEIMGHLNEIVKNVESKEILELIETSLYKKYGTRGSNLVKQVAGLFQQEFDL